MQKVTHKTDLCVVGGGMSGWATAIAAARHGVDVVLMHDRPVLGGNASSECRVHICGADRHNQFPHMRETGLLEEVRLLNLARNPNSNFTIWDTLLYEMVMREKRITLLLNCSCFDAEKTDGKIVSVTGWQMTTEKMHTINAKWFADCSGDGILAPLIGADFRVGREGRDEYGETFAPEKSDGKTMGHSIRFELRKHDTPQTFIPPEWAHKYDDCLELPYGLGGHSGNLIGLGYWWIEVGGEQDSIADTENIRDELLKIVYGVWDHIKNRCPARREDAECLSLEWFNFLPAKRESRRYIGEYVLTQNDLAEAKEFNDIVAYGGWSMDDHDPAGFYAVADGNPATIFHQCRSPYGIPFRSLYSRNVENLFFAGRNISATHMAMSSTRVMGTCTIMGQAVGTAVGFIKEKDLQKPGEVLGVISELQQRLLLDDCYLPGVPLAVSRLTLDAKLSASNGNPESVRNGIFRQVDDEPNSWVGEIGDWLAYEFTKEEHLRDVSVAFDSAMDVDIALSISNHCYGKHLTTTPGSLIKSFAIELMVDGEWQNFFQDDNNIQRYRSIQIEKKCYGVRLRILSFHDNNNSGRIYTFVAG